MFADGLDKKHEKCVETSDSTLLAGTTGRIELTLIQFFKRQEFKSFMEGIPGAQVCVLHTRYLLDMQVGVTNWLFEFQRMDPN